MKNVEILIPSWPDARDPTARVGAADYDDSFGSIDSFRFQFRARQTSEGYLPEYQYRCWMDIGLTIFIHKDGQVGIEIRAQDVHSASLENLEHLIKCLKWVRKAAGDLLSTNPDTLPFVLMSLCGSLGIKRTVQYRGISVDETYAPVSEALELICDECRRRHARLQ